jgi:hypothetical protein
MLSLTLYRWDITPLGVGLAGEGAARPFPCLGLSLKNLSRGITPHPLSPVSTSLDERYSLTIPPGTISIYL